MNAFSESVSVALNLIAQADAALWQIVALSLRVSTTACALGAGFGLLLGAWLAVARFPGHAVVVGVLNTLLALPSVVVGLVVYLLLSRSGPLGSWGILFTPTAMVIAQSILVVPLIAALTRQPGGRAARGRRQLRSPWAPGACCRRCCCWPSPPGGADGAADGLSAARWPRWAR
jgi:tungstate transport system permease protein